MTIQPRVSVRKFAFLFLLCRSRVCIRTQQLMRTRVYSVSQAAGCRHSFRTCGLWRNQVTDGRAGTKPKSRNLQTHTHSHKHKSPECASAATSQCCFNSQMSSLILLSKTESSLVRSVLDSITLPSNTSQSGSTNGRLSSLFSAEVLQATRWQGRCGDDHLLLCEGPHAPF